MPAVLYFNDRALFKKTAKKNPTAGPAGRKNI